MKKVNIAYWIITIIFAGFMAFSGVMSIMNPPENVALMNHLQYPQYLASFLGVAKVLGAIAIVIPGFPRLKEWAYAGLVFDLIGATYSMIAVGDPASGWGFMLVFFVLAFASYFLYHRRRALREANNAAPAMAYS